LQEAHTFNMKIEKTIILPGIADNDYPLIDMYDEVLRVSKELPEDIVFVETGTRNGDSAMVILKGILDSGKKRWLFTVDPYGDKPYGIGSIVSSTYGYDEQHYRNAMMSLSKYAWDNDLLHYHYRMLSQEFHLISEQTEFWHKANKVQHKYGFVYLDGEHTFNAITKELEFFLPRLVKGGVVIVDDISFITEDEIKALPIQGEIKHNKLFYKHI
jgi:hypothetical protein